MRHASLPGLWSIAIVPGPALGLRIGASVAPDECQRKSLPVVSVGPTMGERWPGRRITRAADPRSDAAVPGEVLKRCAGGWDQFFSMSA